MAGAALADAATAVGGTLVGAAAIGVAAVGAAVGRPLGRGEGEVPSGREVEGGMGEAGLGLVTAFPTAAFALIELPPLGLLLLLL